MYTAKVITEDEYKTLRARYNEYHAQRKVICKHPNVVTVEEQALLPKSLTSEEISSIETYEFCFDPPQKYFAYVHEENREGGILRLTHVTTWTGEILGRITWRGARYNDNFGGERVPIDVAAINGKHYYGVYYRSAGDYCRLTMRKADR